MLQVTFNPGLTVTGFRTTRPRTLSDKQTINSKRHRETTGSFR